MKNKHKIWLTFLAGASLAGCADQEIDNYYVEKPASIAQYEYLNEYGNLKDYLRQRSDINPNFKLGTGVGAADYNKFGQVYRVTNANFDQITAGNAMKYASIVKENGDMDFSTVTAFVDAATQAGIEVYGHTLCWHEQQTVKYLNSLIADKELPPVVAEGKCLHINTPQANANPWDWQNYYDLDTPLKGGVHYIFTMRTKASAAMSFPLWIETPNAGNTHYGIPQISAGTTWGDLKIDFTPSSDCSRLLFCFGQFGGDIWLDDLMLVAEGSEDNLIKNGDFESPELDGWAKPGWHSHSFKIEDTPGDSEVIYWEALTSGGDAESGECANVISREPGKGDSNSQIVADELGTGNVFVCPIVGSPVNAWDSQFFIKFNSTLAEGEKIHVKFRYRCSDTRNIDTQAHGNPGEYHHWAFIGTLNATPEWKDHEWIGQISGEMAGANGCTSIAFNLSSTDAAGKFYVDDVLVEVERKSKGNTVPMTPEEKAEALTNEMERWIKGMMEATAGQVKAWDVVNEAISGGPWGQRYDLQHAATGSGDQSNKFYWQDYLGDNFVRVPVKFARQYFAEFGGNPEELKLFVNDYNLESDWDDNQKLKSLISWIEQWESDGVTKIDGIGSQMHVSYYMNPQTQASKEEHVVKMLQLLASSGKLVRITELDMGICDEEGNAIKTENVTFEQQKAMAEYYRFIIEKYFEIIPRDQQYGICQWAQTDSPDGSGWRAGEPIGLWNLNYSRKPTYGGFADGLAGKRQ